MRNDQDLTTHSIGVFGDVTNAFKKQEQVLRQAERNGRILALLFLDLNHFNPVNDQ